SSLLRLGRLTSRRSRLGKRRAADYGSTFRYDVPGSTPYTIVGGGSGSAGTELCPSAYRATGLHAIRLRLEACRRTIQETQSPPHRMFFARTLNTAPRDAASNPPGRAARFGHAR